MKCTSLKILEWSLFIGFSIVAAWFSSGVVEHFFSQKSSFSQAEEPITDYPVIGILFRQKSSEVKLTNVDIYYQSKGMSDLRKLKIGKNYLSNEKYDKTDIVLLESFKHYRDLRSCFRIIHLTPILEKNRERVNIQVLHNIENKSKSIFSDMVSFYLTSLKNSPGFIYNIWRDGKPLDVVLNKNTHSDYNIQPEQYKFLEKTGNCQQEPYFQCIAKQLDIIEFKNCSKKCLPYVFSNVTAINFSIPFCQDDYNSEENHQIRQRCHSIRQ